MGCTIPFIKMHGLGNDFVVLDCRDGVPGDLSSLARVMCRRRTSVGADGLIAICPSEVAVCRMRIFNADGSEAEMCGNGIRCVAGFAYSRGMTSCRSFLIETRAGLRRVSLGDDGQVTVEMGSAVCSAPCRVSARGEEMTVTPVSVGNPHGVVYVPSAEDAPVGTAGPVLECDRLWPDRANIEFVEVVSPHSARVRVWERGVGETDACGTGACAAAAAAVAAGRCEFPVAVSLPGGDLAIDMLPEGTVTLTGPYEEVFQADFNMEISL